MPKAALEHCIPVLFLFFFFAFLKLLQKRNTGTSVEKCRVTVTTHNSGYDSMLSQQKPLLRIGFIVLNTSNAEATLYKDAIFENHRNHVMLVFIG